MNNVMDIFYGVLFHPVDTFRQVSYEKPYKLPLIIVVLASVFLLILSENTIGFASLALFVSKALNLIIYWLFFAFFVDLISKLFNNSDGNYSKLLTLTALSYTPWIFLAPLKLLKNTCDVCSDIATLLLLFIWGWTVVLHVLAISETYNIPRKNAIVVLFVPFVGTILYIVWIVDFFVKLFQISAM